MKKIYDVLVVGAGPSGMASAVAAAREGASVLLIEKNGCPGGMNTMGMVCPLMTFHAGEHQVVKGFAQEVIDRLAARDATLGHIPDPIGMVSTITPVDTEMLKLVYFDLLREEKGISVLLYTMLESTKYENGQIKSVTVVNKSGKETYTAKNYIDATGDGDLAAMCQADFIMGRIKDGMPQPMTLMFSVGGVDIPQIVKYVRKNPEQFILNRACDLEQYLAVSGFFSLVKQAKNNGDFSLPRDRVLLFQGMRPNEVVVNMTRISCLSSVNAKDLTAAEFESHKQAEETLLFLRKYVPGFANCYLSAFAAQTGIRESRRIKGLKTLTLKHVLNNVEHKDSVAMCAFPVDIHDPAGNELNWMRKEKICCYDIPYGVMVPLEFHNLLVTGRCISASHEALASVRISVTAMALGEAAGITAALTSKNNCKVDQVDIDELQKTLVKRGAVPGKRWL